jgi:PAS domain S-box-containing protein
MKKSYINVAPLVGMVLLVVLLVSLTFWTFGQIDTSAKTRKHTFIVINKADDLLSALKDAETGQRGYLLTGDEAFLQPYVEVRDSISGQLKELRLLTIITASRKHLDAMVPLVDAKLAEMSQVITLGRTHNMTAVTAAVGGGQGKRLMDLIRTEMRSFMQIEEDALARHDAEFQSKMHSLFTVIVIVSLFMLLLALLFAYLLHRETQQRLKNIVHLETKHRLEIQEEMNKQLQQVNVSLQESEEKTQRFIGELEIARIEMEAQNAELQRSQYELENQQIELELQNEELAQSQAESDVSMKMLRDSKEEIAVTLNSIGDAVIATDAEALVTRLNPIAERLTGWTLAEAIGRPAVDIFHIVNKDTRHPAPIPIMEAIAHGTIQGLANHTVLIARDGSEYDIADSCAPIRNHDDQVVGAVLVFRDVSEEYAVQQSLRDSAALVRTILNTVADGIITIHACGGIVETVNPAAEQMFGYTASELGKQNFSLLIPELDQGQRDGSLEFYGASDEARAIGLGREVMGRRKDGSIFPLEMVVSEMWLGGQRYFTGILRDTTVRKQIEEEQKQLSQRLRDHQFYTRSLFESNIDAIMTTDPSGIITDVNKQMEVLTDCTHDELIGAPFKNYFTDPDRAKTGIELVLREKNVTNYELTARTRDGKETVVSINATTFYDRDRKLQGVFAAARDVTERKRLDQVLQEKNVELESARSLAEKTNLTKSDFLANMSHELRTPLNSVIGFSEVLQDQMFGQINEKQNEYVNNILTSGRHLLSLINDILDLSKVESGKMELELSTFSLFETVDASLMMLREKAMKGGIEIHLDLDPEADVRIVADQRKLKQILFNLLSNAVKFTPTAGTVNVSAVRDGDFIGITVADTGIGIREEDISKLFQAFTQLESVYTKGFEGTGLGLALTRQLVELHGGRIWVKSELGEGCRFSFTIPLTQAADTEPPATRPDTVPGSGSGSGNTVLVIEDDPLTLAAMENALLRKGYRALRASSGKDGIEMAQRNSPDLIVLDLVMPGMNGFDVADRLRNENSSANVPILVLTSMDLSAADRARLAGKVWRIEGKESLSTHEFLSLVENAVGPM